MMLQVLYAAVYLPLAVVFTMRGGIWGFAFATLIANSLREINAERVQQGESAFSVPPRMEALEDELPAPEWLARECLPYGLAALLCADDDKAKFNWAADEYAERLLLHCPAQFTAVQEMV